MAASEPNSKAKIKIIRNEKEKILELTIGERPEDKFLVKKTTAEPKPEKPAKKNTPHNLGAEIEDSTKQIRQQFGINDEVKNPVATAVERDSLASRIGLRVGDVILNINGKEIKSEKDVRDTLKKGTNTMRVARGRGLSAMTFDIP